MPQIVNERHEFTLGEAWQKHGRCEVSGSGRNWRVRNQGGDDHG